MYYIVLLFMNVYNNDMRVVVGSYFNFLMADLTFIKYNSFLQQG
jgi:hypothetical protein